ncbi:hypothetical protein [Actibacterium sp. D379-3]
MTVIAISLDPQFGAVACMGLLRPADIPVGVVVANGQIRLFAQADATPSILWQDEGATDAPAPDMVADGAGGLLCLIPGQALLRISLQDGGPVCDVLRIDGALPVRLFFAAGTAYGLFEADAGAALRIVPLTVGGDALKVGPGFDAPVLAEPATLSGLAQDDQGGLVAVADNRRVGFQLWRQGPGGDWAQLIGNGATRHGLNAAILDLMPWGGFVALAAGPGRDVRRRLLNMPIAGELLLLRADGTYHMICGETRTSESGLKTPLAGAGNPAARDVGSFTRMVPDGDGLLTALQRDGGTARIYRVGPDFHITAVADLNGVVCGLWPGRETGDPAIVAVCPPGA